jgi:hypothetical protein
LDITILATVAIDRSNHVDYSVRGRLAALCVFCGPSKSSLNRIHRPAHARTLRRDGMPVQPLNTNNRS